MDRAWSTHGSDAFALVDLTAVNAVQSLFDKGPRDPWAIKVAEDFVDLMVWQDRVRYPVLLLTDSADEHHVVTPPVVRDIQRRDPGSLTPGMQVLENQRELDPELLAPTLRDFAAFAANNSRRIHGFLELHQASWIKDQIRSRFKGDSHFIFNADALRQAPETATLAARLRLPEEAIPYLLDLILKYLIYAEQANGQYYLSHPIRSKQVFHFLRKDIISDEATQRPVPFRIGPHIVGAARHKDQDWFTSRIHEARGHVREHGMTEMQEMGTIERDSLRRLAARLRLPAQVRRLETADKALVVASAASGALASGGLIEKWPVVAATSLTVTRRLWTGNVPGSISGITWLQWMFEWPIERGASGER
jgi:hypothetical protein